MALNFPSSPTANTTYTFNGKSWTYNGTAWALDYGTLNTGVVTAGVNLYFTNARAIAALTAGQSITIDANGRINSTATGGGGSSAYGDSNVILLGYATNANVALKANVVDLTTANVVELGNLYYTDTRARDAISVTGFGEYDNTTGIVSIYQQNVSVNGRIGPVSGLAETNNSLSQFASTTSLELITLISDETGSGNLVFSTNPVLFTPNIGTPSYANLTYATSLPISTGVSGLGVGVAAYLADPTSVGLSGFITDETGTGNLVFSTNPVLFTPNIGTPSYANLTYATSLPISTGISGLGTGVAAYLANPTSAGLKTIISDETGTGALVFATSPDFITPNIGTPSYATLTNATGLPILTGVSGLGYRQSELLGIAAATGVANTTYGGATVVPVITVDVYGRITSASNVALSSSGGVTSVGGATGAVSNAQLASAIITSNVLTTANTAEVTNLYYTDTRARAALSGTTGVAYNSSTGVIALTQNIDPHADVTFNNLTVTGNINVLGNAVIFSSNTLQINDSLIQLGFGNPADIIDIGFIGHYNDGVTERHAGVFRDATDKKFKFFDNITGEPAATIVDTANASFRLATVVALAVEGNYFSGVNATFAANVTTGNISGSRATFTNSDLGTVTTGTWNGTSIGTVYTDAKVVSVGGAAGTVSNTQVASAVSQATISNVTISGNVIAGNVTISPSGVLKFADGTYQNTAYFKPRLIVVADATSVTINADITDIAEQVNTQAVGTLTINAPTGTLADGQKLIFRLQSTNVQTFSWNAAFVGSTDLALPTVSTGSSKYDYVGFIYNSTAVKWQLLAKNFGF